VLTESLGYIIMSLFNFGLKREICDTQTNKQAWVPTSDIQGYDALCDAEQVAGHTVVGPAAAGLGIGDGDHRAVSGDLGISWRGRKEGHSTINKIHKTHRRR